MAHFSPFFARTMLKRARSVCVCVCVCVLRDAFWCTRLTPPPPPGMQPGIKAPRRPAPGFHRYPSSAAGQSYILFVQHVHSEPAAIASPTSTTSTYSKCRPMKRF
jgi:hypothetical protein